MQFDDDKVDLSELDDRRGRSAQRSGPPRATPGAGGPAVSGAAGKSLMGMGAVGVVILIALLLLTGGGGSAPPRVSDAGQQAPGQALAGDPRDMAARCVSSQAILGYDDCYVLKSFNEINEVWGDYFGGRGQRYGKPTLVYFTSAVSTGCGMARSSTGPFYCPPDQTVYIDLDYMGTLFRQIGASGRYAQSYVVAHEVGHHLQTLLGTEERVRRLQQRSPRDANALSVRLELQADCFAGVYGRVANDAGNQRITEAEYLQAMQAAAAVGDDAIMSGAGMRVNPDTFTHGSSAERQRWFETGFAAGTITACDTFA